MANNLCYGGTNEYHETNDKKEECDWNGGQDTMAVYALTKQGLCVPCYAITVSRYAITVSRYAITVSRYAITVSRYALFSSLHCVTSSLVYYSTHTRKNVIYFFYTIKIQRFIKDFGGA